MHHGLLPHRDERPGPAERFELRWRGLAVITLAMFISAVDTTIVNVALPDIAAGLGAGINELQWVIDAFLVALAGLLLVASGLADRFGRRRIFLAGFGGFAVASVLASSARTPEELIAARVLMGAATAFILPPALSLLSVMFPAAERPRAVSIWAAVAGLGIAVGPVLGGLLIDLAGWRWVFLINVPVALVAIPAGLRLLPESVRPGSPPLDLGGALLSALALGGVVFALIEGVREGWTAPAVLAAAFVGLGAAFAFVRTELRRRDPLLDVRVLARPRVRAGGVGVVAMYAALMGMFFLIPQYLQYVQGRSALLSGVALAPLGLGLAIASPLAGRLSVRYMPRRVLGLGLLAMSASMLPLALLGPGSPLAQVSVSVLAMGLAYGIAITPATQVIMDDLGAERAGDAAAVNQLARQGGGALGVAAVGSLFAALYGSILGVGSLPAGLRAGADASIEGAQAAAVDLPAAASSRLLTAAVRAFDDAAAVGLLLCAGLLLAAAIHALLSARAAAREGTR